MADPTALSAWDHQRAFEHFNAALFEGRVPPCVLTLSKNKKYKGYFLHGTFLHRGAGRRLDEISLNPQTYEGLTTYLSTLVHEMVHALQQAIGSPGRRGFHNSEWSKMMVQCGLQPLSLEQGRQNGTGRRVTHAIIEGGPFDLACQALLNTGFGFQVVHIDPPPEDGSDPESDEYLRKERKDAKRASKTRFFCPECLQNAWAQERQTGVRAVPRAAEAQ